MLGQQEGPTSSVALEQQQAAHEGALGEVLRATAAEQHVRGPQEAGLAVARGLPSGAQLGTGGATRQAIAAEEEEEEEAAAGPRGQKCLQPGQKEVPPRGTAARVGEVVLLEGPLLDSGVRQGPYLVEEGRHWTELQERR